MSEPSEKESKSDRWSDLPEYDVEKLDYDYVGKCENLQELKDIHTVLTSGKEGRYFELEKFTEERMIKFMSPKEKTLWIARHREVTQAEKLEAADDILNWASNMKQTDEELRAVREQQQGENANKNESKYNQDDDDEDSDDNGDIFTEKKAKVVISSNSSTNNSHLPPVRNQINSNASTRNSTVKPNNGQDSDDDDEEESNSKPVDPKDKKYRYSYDYFKEWDKFDIEGELSKIDDLEKREEERKKARERRNKEKEKERFKRMERDLKALGLRSDMLSQMSMPKRKVIAEKEKQKGNECFRSKEFDEAYMYYSRSLFFDNSNHIVYANRAMANLRLKKFDKAEEDCSRSLAIEPTYVKALTRRGMARHKRGKYIEAIEDFKTAIELQPSNKELRKLMQSSKKMYADVGGIVTGGKAAEQKKSTRISIVEVDDEEDESSEEEEDDDDDSEEDGEEEGGTDAVFISAKKFQGAKPGYVFKKDTKGLGYYLDPKQKKVITKTTVNPVDTGAKKAKSSDSPKSVDSDGYVQLESPTHKDLAMSDDERIQAGSEAKIQGSNFFKSGKLEDAFRSFSRAIDLFPTGHEEEIKCLNNRALVCMRLARHEDVVQDCTRVLESKSGKDNVKALLRRGAAREEIEDFQGALDDMCTVMKLDPSREPVSKAISRLLVKMQNNGNKKSSSTNNKKKKDKKKEAMKKKSAAEKDNKKTKDEEKIIKNAKAKAVKEKKKAAAAAAKKKVVEKKKKEEVPKAPQVEATKPKVPEIVKEEEKLTKSAEEYKDDGNAFFKAKKYTDAISSYDKAIKVDKKCIPAIANRAMAKLQVKDYEGTVADCTNGISYLNVDKESNRTMHVKLLYRRAMGNKSLGKLSTALDDFNTILAKEPGNKRALKEKEQISKIVAPPQNPETVNRVQRMRDANTLAEKAAKALSERKGKMTFNAPNSYLEFEKARKELQSNISEFAEYLLLVKPKKLKKILKSSLTEEILATTIKALASEFIPDRALLALSYLKHLSKVPRFDTTVMFLGDEYKQLLRSIFSHLKASGEKPDVVKTVQKAWKI